MGTPDKRMVFSRCGLDWQWILIGQSLFTILPSSSILLTIVLPLVFGIVLIME
jgi:hypothetical protein